MDDGARDSIEFRAHCVSPSMVTILLSCMNKSKLKVYIGVHLLPNTELFCTTSTETQLLQAKCVQILFLSFYF